MESKVKVPTLQFTVNKEPFREPKPNVRMDIIIKAKAILLKGASFPHPTKPPPPIPKTHSIFLLLLHI